MTYLAFAAAPAATVASFTTSPFTTSSLTGGTGATAGKIESGAGKIGTCGAGGSMGTGFALYFQL